MTNHYIKRSIEQPLRDCLEQGKSILLLGARQTGKTTLLKHLALSDMSYTLLDPELRLRFEKNPNGLAREVLAHKKLSNLSRPLVIIDEIQKVPSLMDVVQLLIDNQEAQFVLTGSSVRKLRRHAQFNLLPGRVINFFLDPLSISECHSDIAHALDKDHLLKTLLSYGSLPGIYLETNLVSKQKSLESYVSNYLNEEIRGEALARDLGSFARFLELAAVESGNQLNISNLSQEIGIHRHTLTEYFNVLEDCLIAEKIEPFSHSHTRKRLSKTPKFLMFDLGIRLISAREQGNAFSEKMYGDLLEQMIGLELRRMAKLISPTPKILYWRDHAGPEVDYLIDFGGNPRRYLPIEVKWTANPSTKDARHLNVFLENYPEATAAYIICRVPKPTLIDDRVMALPWWLLDKVFAESQNAT